MGETESPSTTGNITETRSRRRTLYFLSIVAVTLAGFILSSLPYGLILGQTRITSTPYTVLLLLVILSLLCSYPAMEILFSARLLKTTSMAFLLASLLMLLFLAEIAFPFFVVLLFNKALESKFYAVHNTKELCAS